MSQWPPRCFRGHHGVPVTTTESSGHHRVSVAATVSQWPPRCPSDHHAVLVATTESQWLPQCPSGHHGVLGATTESQWPPWRPQPALSKHICVNYTQVTSEGGSTRGDEGRRAHSTQTVSYRAVRLNPRNVINQSHPGQVNKKQPSHHLPAHSLSPFLEERGGVGTCIILQNELMFG